MKFFILVLFSASVIADSIFMSGYRKIEDYTLCQDHSYRGRICDEMMKDWVEAHPEDNWKAAKMTRKVMNSWVAIPYFEKAKDSKDFDCKDEDLKLAVMSGLNLPASGNEAIVNASAELGLVKCKDQLGESIAKEAGADSYAFANACQKMDLQGLKKKKCEAISKGKK